MTLVVVAEDMNFATCGFSAGNLKWFEKPAFFAIIGEHVKFEQSLLIELNFIKAGNAWVRCAFDNIFPSPGWTN